LTKGVLIVSSSDDSDSAVLLQTAQELENNRKKTDASSAYLELALLSISNNQVTKAKSYLKKSTQLNRNKGEAWFQLGLLEMKDSCYHSARELFKKAVRTRPKVVEHHVEYGVVNYMLREWESAVTSLLASMDLQRTHRGLQYLGLTFLELGAQTAAIEYLQAALALSEENQEIAFSLGCGFFRAGDISQALVHLQESVEDPNHQRVKVKKRIRDALDIGNDRVESWMCLGDIFDSINRRWEAIIALEVATRVNPNHARAWYELSELHLNYRLYDDARSQAWMLDPKDPDILCSNGIGFYESGLKKYAFDTFVDVLGLDPNHGGAQYWINKIEEEFEELEELGHSPWLGEYGYYYDEDRW
jgi:tetratricopeptide (TPR) repeat protein